MNINDLISRFDDVKTTGNGFEVHCPAHRDNKKSLCIHQTPDGKILMKCQAGCETADIVKALRITFADLFPETDKLDKLDKLDKANVKSRSKTAKADTTTDSAIITANRIKYEYVDEENNHLFFVLREIDPETGKKSFRQYRKESGKLVYNIKNTRRVLYRLPQLLKAVEENKPIFFVEGEKDVHNLEKLGFTATSTPGGASSKWLQEYTNQLSGANVIVIPDNDEPGRKHASKIIKNLSGHASAIRVIKLSVKEHGDVSDWIAGGHTADELKKIVNDTPPLSPNAQGEAEKINLGLDGEMLNDLGNARRLVNKYGNDIKYCCDAGQWYYWDGSRWKTDNTDQLFIFAQNIVYEMQKLLEEESKNVTTEEQESAIRVFQRHVTSSGNHHRLEAMLKTATTFPGIQVFQKQLDADPMLLNCENGVVDLRNGIVRMQERKDLITKIAGTVYDPMADCSSWEKFLFEIFDGDTDLIDYVQCALGYSLTGLTSEQCFFILHGAGSNGKSTFINVVREILNEYEKKTSTETLTEKDRNQTNDIANLVGARFVSAIETSAGKKLAEALVKELTGGDTISARYLYHEFFQFKPVFKLWLACNHILRIEGQDYGIWRRIRLIRFNVCFQPIGAPEGPYMVKNLDDKLRQEYPGILRWMVDGANKWHKQGLIAPKSVLMGTDELQRDMDPLGGFLSDCCVIMPQAEVSAKELYAEYREWCDKNGEKYMTQRWFGLRLGERAKFKRQRKMDGYIWTGIGLINLDNMNLMNHSDPFTFYGSLENKVDLDEI